MSLPVYWRRNSIMQDQLSSKLDSVWQPLFLMFKQRNGENSWKQFVVQWMLVFVISNRDMSFCIIWSHISIRIFKHLDTFCSKTYRQVFQPSYYSPCNLGLSIDPSKCGRI
ncbi:hypothetical protein P3S67_008065 [Capsicum chacoense]